jgi:hypothetical protein
MTISKPILQNIIAFLERADSHGKEAFSWCEAYMAVQAEITPPAPPTPPDAPPA